MNTSVVGVDMGGTKILAAVVDATGNILGTAKVPTEAKKKTSIVIDRIADCIQKAIQKSTVATDSIQAVGIGAPGALDPETGVVIFAPNLGWKNVPLKSELETRVDIPIFVDNDVNVGTLGEHTYGAGQNVQNLVGIFVGTGIGGGIILNGELSTVQVRQQERSDISLSKRAVPMWVWQPWLLRSTGKPNCDDENVSKCYSEKEEKKYPHKTHQW